MILKISGHSHLFPKLYKLLLLQEVHRRNPGTVNVIHVDNEL